jgi:hypothetical protein
MSDPKNVLLEVAGEVHFSEDGSQCSIEVSAADGQQLSPQIVLDACVDMIMAHFGMAKEDWERLADEDLDS